MRYNNRISHFLLLAALFFCNGVRADHYPFNFNIDVQHYSFQLTLSDNSDEIEGIASITILFKTADVKNFRLDFTNVTAATNGKGMNINSVQLNGQSVSYVHQNDALIINLPEPSLKNQRLTFVINYHGIPDDGLRIGPTKYGDRSFFSENWPNKTRHWLPCIDHPYDKATSEFIIKAPNHYQVISNGLLLEETNLNATTKLTHWKQSVPVSSWLYVLGVAEFAVQYLGEFDGKSLQTWVYPKDREAGFRDFAEPSKEVLQFYSDYIGPYVYEKLANVQATSHGGMETSSAIFYTDGLVTGNRTKSIRNVIIHEIAHQWFGNSVTESTWDDAWLSEGFATFFTQRFIEHAYGHDEYVQGFLKAKESVYNTAKKEPDFSVVADRTAESGAPVTNGLTYQKGAWFLHMLRNRLGETDFKKGIRSYYNHFMNANASTADFRYEMEQASGQDLHKFFDQWLYHSDLLFLKGSWKYDSKKKQILIKMEQNSSGSLLFDFPFQIGVFQKGTVKPQVTGFNMNTKTGEFTIPCNVKPERVVFDPETLLLAQFEFTEAR